MNKLYGLIIPVLLLSACTQNNSQKANALLDDAREAIEEKSFDKARSLIDSLRETYPQEVDARRSALSLMDTLELENAKQELIIADSIFTFQQFELEDLKKNFILEKQEKYQTTGYYVTNDYAGSKSSYSYFTEVEETGTLLAVNIYRTNGIKYDFTPIEIDLNSDAVPSSVKPLSAKEQASFEQCYRLARAMKQFKEAKENKEKYQLKVRFFEKKISE